MAKTWTPRFKKGDRIRLDGVVTVVRENGADEPLVTVKLDGVPVPVTTREYHLEPADTPAPPVVRKRRFDAM
jgi:hypothetical protein